MLDENGILRAEIEFPDTGVNTVTITHTFVDETLKGRGIAQRLTETVVMQAEKKEKRFVPYARTPFAGSPVIPNMITSWREPFF